MTGIVPFRLYAYYNYMESHPESTHVSILYLHYFIYGSAHVIFTEVWRHILHEEYVSWILVEEQK